VSLSPHLKEHTTKDLGAVKGTPHSADTYKSKMQRDHPTLRPKNNWRERKNAGNEGFAATGTPPAGQV
jgi:hypothetical protein